MTAIFILPGLAEQMLEKARQTELEDQTTIAIRLAPEQIGRAESCSTCALCWQSERRIAVVQH